MKLHSVGSFCPLWDKSIFVGIWYNIPCLIGEGEAKLLKINKMVLISLNIIVVVLLSACFSEKDLEQPVKDYLSKEYGIKEDIKILSTDNNWLEGIDHQTFVEIEKPYLTKVYLMIERDTLAINEIDSDDIFLEIFKGAYVEQHKDVVNQANKVIKKYSLMEKSPDEYDMGKQNFYYFLNFNMQEEQEKDLIEQFKTTQTLNTEEILPSLKMNESSRNVNYLGVVNFIFLFNTYNNKAEIPKAQNIVAEFEKSHVLTEGIYNIAVNTIEASDDSISLSYYDDRNTNVLFSVDQLGRYVIRDIK